MSSVVVVEKDAKRVTMKQTLALVASSILVSGALYGVANPNLAPYCKAISPFPPRSLRFHLSRRGQRRIEKF